MPKIRDSGDLSGRNRRTEYGGKSSRRLRWEAGGVFFMRGLRGSILCMHLTMWSGLSLCAEDGRSSSGVSISFSKKGLPERRDFIMSGTNRRFLRLVFIYGPGVMI